MATTSPPPNPLPSAVPPALTGTDAPPPSSSMSSPPPNLPTTSSPAQPNANPPDSSLTTPPPSQSPSPPQPSVASPAPTTSRPPTVTSPHSPPTQLAGPPASSSPPPQASGPPTFSSPPPDPPTASPPPQTTPPPPPQSSPPPPVAQSPAPDPPTAFPPPLTTSSPPPQSSPPPPPSTSPPPQSSPPPPSSSPPPLSSPPPQSSPPPPSSTSPPPQSSPPPTPSTSPPPQSSPPPPSSTSPPPHSSPPPPSSKPPPENSPPPTSANSPPPAPASSNPPKNSPPPPATQSNPPANSPPPPSLVPPPRQSPPPPTSTSPASSPSPPLSRAPAPDNAPPPPRLTPTPPSLPSNSTPKETPPSPVIRLSPPPTSVNSSPPSSPPSTVNGTIPSAPGTSNSTGNGGINAGVMVAIGVAVGIIVLSLIGLAIWCFKKRRREVSRLNGGYVMPTVGSSPRTDTTASKMHSTVPLIGSGSSGNFIYSPSEPGGLGNSRSWFTFEELIKATDGFSTQNLLGEGGFGSVYKGCLPDGREIAVKQLKIGGGQGEREFKAEVEIISRIHHRHLVSLVGYCISNNRRLLVYDYVPNNTLHFHLHGEGRPVLDWGTRVRIAAGAARGIAYLHEDCNPRIIHRDIKSSNILLDNNFEAKVSDFGLAKLALDANTHITTRVMGTFGYMAPEYASSGKLTEKSDVFSYGVVLLELITGRKPVDASQPLGDESLVEWARPLLGHAIENEQFEALVDPRLEKNYVESEMLLMIEAAAACVRHSAAKRPKMGQVVRAFDSLATSDLNNGMRVGESEVFNSAQQSEEIKWFRRMAFGSQNYSTEVFTQGSLDAPMNMVNICIDESSIN